MMLDILPSPFISVIIPAFNEAEYIYRLFEGLSNQTYPRERFEVIVADNGSTDKTQQLAATYADKLVVIPGGNVAAVRNAGAAQAKGNFLAFLDADCIPYKTWLEKGAQAFIEGEEAFGNKVGIPQNAGWIERAWFSQRTNRIRDVAYINSANFFVARNVFTGVEGFDENLRSGEDWDICQRIRKAGHTVRSRPEICVVHLKNPKTLLAFVKREVWHGIGGLQSFRANPFDKPLLASFAFMAATFVQIAGLFFGYALFLLGSAAIFFLIFLSATNNVRRFQNYKYFFQIAVLYYFYFLGRSGSVFWFVARALNLKIISGLVGWAYDSGARIVAWFEKKWRPNEPSGLRILCYHSVSDITDGKLYPSSNVLLKDFKEQMQFLKKNGFYPISFDELEAYLDGKFDLPPKSFLVTFDDGFRNIKKNAVPVLEDLGFSCIIFVTTDYIGHRQPFPFVDWYSFGEQKNEFPLSLDEGFLPLAPSDISELAAMEKVLIGSHGAAHLPYPAVSLNEQNWQLAKSRQVLENITNYRVNHFAYPHGAYDRPSLDVTRQFYPYVYSVEKGRVIKGDASADRPIHRHSINAKHTIADFKTQVSGGYDPFRKAIEHFRILF